MQIGEDMITTINFDMYQTAALAVAMLSLGKYLTKKISFLSKFCIPAPVTGGLVFAVFTCISYALGIIEFSFDKTLGDMCMVFFFTSVGFKADLKMLKKGGSALGIMLILLVALIFGQNIVAVTLANLIGESSFIGLCAGSIPMVGGHGTAVAFGPLLEDFGVTGATTFCTAAATFGLIAGSLMGGPLGRNLIERKDLLSTAVPLEEFEEPEAGKGRASQIRRYTNVALTIIVAVGVGSCISYMLTKSGLTFPVYIGALLAGAVMRNISEFTNLYDLNMNGIDRFGDLCLQMFLGIAMITLKIWQLVDLALPLIILLTGQTVFMLLFARFIVFRAMGRNYDAAIISSGICGFGMGAMPNAMANMQATCSRYVHSAKAYLLIPVIGSIFADLFNSLIITFFINVLK